MDYEPCYRNLRDKTTFIGGLEVVDSLVLLLLIAFVMRFVRSGFLQFGIIIASWQGLVFFKKGKPAKYFQHIVEFYCKRKKSYPAVETKGCPFNRFEE